MTPDYAVIDVETTLLKHGERPKTLFWGYADSTGYRKFHNTNSFKRFLYQQEPKYLLHHSNFDVIQLLIDGASKLSIIRSHNGKLIMCKLHHHILLNTYAMFPCKLADIMESFGYAKTPLDELGKRNYEDCVIGLECFLKLDAAFEDLCGQSPLRKHTIASTAFSAAEHIAGKLPKDLRFVEAYRGAKTEVYDTNPYYADKYDINSSYPFSICDAPKTGTLLTCRIKSKDWYCPFFDASDRTKLLFPAGQFRTFVFEENLNKYYEPFDGTLTVESKEIIDLSWLEPVSALALKVFNKKASVPKQSGMYLCCKLFLNSLYGRIGLKGETERTRIMRYMPDGDGITGTQFGWNTFIVWDTIYREPRSNYPMAAFITDNARARLYRAFVETNAIYGDTDSLVALNSKPSNIGQGLGQWKHEGCEVFRANNLKDYQWGETRYLKGGLTSNQWTMKRAARGQPVAQVDKEFSLELRKRVLLPNGSTNPIVVDTI